MDSNKKSIYKTITWHILHVVMVSIVALIVTGSVKIAAILASAEFMWESGAFYLHERAWAKFGHKVK